MKWKTRDFFTDIPEKSNHGDFVPHQKTGDFHKIDLNFAGDALYLTEYRITETAYHSGVEMGQQLNKIQKRRRRKSYLDRCKAKVRATIAATGKKK